MQGDKIIYLFQILCAGVWHNIVLVLLAVALGLSVPYILQPLYIHGRGMTVLSLTQVR